MTLPSTPKSAASGTFPLYKLAWGGTALEPPAGDVAAALSSLCGEKHIRRLRPPTLPSAGRQTDGPPYPLAGHSHRRGVAWPLAVPGRSIRYSRSPAVITKVAKYIR